MTRVRLRVSHKITHTDMFTQEVAAAYTLAAGVYGTIKTPFVHEGTQYAYVAFDNQPRSAIVPMADLEVMKP